MVANPIDLLGQRVRAKRVGWDEELTVEQLLDFDPFDCDDEDLSGVLVSSTGTIPGVGSVTAWLVDGQEADPKTVRGTADGS